MHKQTQSPENRPWSANPLPHSREYLSWLSDPEVLGLDDIQINETVCVAFGRHVTHAFEGGFDE